jgi:hypothetical protein
MLIKIPNIADPMSCSQQNMQAYIASTWDFILLHPYSLEPKRIKEKIHSSQNFGENNPGSRQQLCGAAFRADDGNANPAVRIMSTSLWLHGKIYTNSMYNKIRSRFIFFIAFWE